MSLRLLADFMACVVAASLGACGSSRGAMSTEDYAIVQTPAGRELRLLVSTCRASSDWLAVSCSHTYYDDGRMWLVVAQLDLPGRGDRMKVYGPLWESGGARRCVTCFAGELFEPRSSDGAIETIRFNERGDVVRLVRDQRGGEVTRERLELSESQARFVRERRAGLPVASAGERRFEQVRSGAGGVVVRREKDGVCRVYTPEGLLKEDAWLSGAFCRAWSEDAANIARVWVPSPDHVVVCYRNVFMRDGKAMDRDRYGVVYSRPDTAARAVEWQELGETWYGRLPLGVFVIDGKVAQLSADGGGLALTAPAELGRASNVLYARPFPEGVEWGERFEARVNDVEGAVVLENRAQERALRQGGGKTFCLFTWRYREGLVVQDSVKLGETFTEGLGGMRPNRAIAIEGR